MPATLALIHLVVAVLAFQPAPHPGGDNGVYVALAQSLLDGGYRDLFDPAAPPHGVFPAGFPAIVAAAMAFGLEPWVGIKMVIVAFSTVAVGLTWFLLRREGRSIAACATLIVALSPGVIALSHWELSDVPFWTFTTAALVLWLRAETRGLPTVAAASALTACAYAVRSAGLPLMIASTLWLAARRKWKELALHLAITAPPAVAWYLWSGSQTGYVSQILSVDPYNSNPGALTITTALSRIGENVALYASTHLPALFSDTRGPVVIAISIALMVLALFGWLSRVRKRDRSVLEIFLPLYAAILFLWLPQLGGERLLLPVYPLILMYAAVAGSLLIDLMKTPFRSVLPVAACAAMLIPASHADIHAVETGTACIARYRDGDRFACLEPKWADFFSLAALTRDALPERSVILSRKPALVYAESGNAGRTYPFTRSPDSLLAAASAAGARYLLLDNLDEIASAYLTPALIQRPAAFCVIHSLGADRATLFGIAPNAATIPDARPDPGAAEVDVSFRRCGGEYVKSGLPLQQ